MQSFSIECRIFRDYLDFVLRLSVIGLENPRHPFGKLDAKRKPFVNWSAAFSRAF